MLLEELADLLGRTADETLGLEQRLELAAIERDLGVIRHQLR